MMGSTRQGYTDSEVMETVIRVISLGLAGWNMQESKSDLIISYFDSVEKPLQSGKSL